MKKTKQPHSIFSPIFLISTVVGVGKIPFCPGTFGSLVAALEFWLYINVIPNILGVGASLGAFYIYLLVILPIAFYAVSRYCKISDSKDPKEVVIDEYYGQYLAQLLSLSFCVKYIENFNMELFLIAVSFVFFRIFDILKPSLVGYCDKNYPGAKGVMLDDIVAGIFAAIATIILFIIIGWL